MSQAENFLNSLTETDAMMYSVDPAIEPHIVVNADRTIAVPDSLKSIAVQYDDNVETVTFDCPRYWDGNDFFTMNVYINYMRSDGYKDRASIKNLRIDENNATMIHFDWTIGKNVTQVAGNISFLICIETPDTDPQVHWNSRLNSDLIVEKGLECKEYVVDQNPDIITDIFTRLNKLDCDGTDDHAEYFTITDDGVLYLKPEYRGACPSMRSEYVYAISDNGLDVAGSKNHQLPKTLFIPAVIDEIAVTCLANGMFLYNSGVEQIVLPDIITEIPERFCDNAIALKAIHNTEYVSTIGKAAFQCTQLEKVQFPNLRSMGDFTFNACGFMVYADIGNVTSIPSNCFNGNMMLSRIKGGTNVTTVGKNAFNLCYRLNSVEFLSNLTSIGDNAFLRCRLRYDWAGLQNCTFGNWATALQLNPTDIWSGCQVTAVENPVPTLLSQNDPRWSDKHIGATGIKYSDGCVLFTIMHIYCALHDLKLDTVEEFEQIVTGIDPNFLNDFSNTSSSHIKTLYERLGLKVEYYTEYTQASLQAVFNGLVAGKYAVAEFAPRYNSTISHDAMIYGVNEKKELLIADSAFSSAEVVGKGEKTIKYSMSYQNSIYPVVDVFIISL